MAGLFGSNPVDAANQALTDNPKLANTPGLALPVINSADPNGTAATIAHTYGMTATQQALQDHAAQGDNQSIWQKAFGGASKVVMGSLSWLNKPLQEIQKDYKYIHSVYTKHGVLEGLMATAGIAGGGLLGTLALPGIGTAIGADVAASLERMIGGHTVTPDSYADSNNPNYKVSMGRDFANLLSQAPGLGTLANTDKGFGKVVSGIGDTAFDFSVDPLLALGKVRTAVRSGDLLAGGVLNTDVVRTSFPGVQDFLQRNSLRISSPDQMDALWKSGTPGSKNLSNALVGSPGSQYRRATEEIAQLANSSEGAGAIVAKYPGLRGIAQTIVSDGTKNVTPQDVHDIFLRSSWDDAFMKQYAVNGQAIVPSRTVLRAAVSKVSDKLHQSGGDEANYLKVNEPGFFVPKKSFAATIQPITDASGNIVPTIVNDAEKSWNMPVVFRALKAVTMPFSSEARQSLADGWRSAIAGKTRTFSSYVPYATDTNLNELSTKKFDPNSADAGQVVYRVARYSMGEKMARQKTSEFLAGDTGAKKDIYSGMLSEAIKAGGLPNDTNLYRSAIDKISMQIHQPLDAGANYGFGATMGNDASLVKTGEKTFAQGAFQDQAGKFVIPDFRLFKQSMRELGAYGKIYGKIDEFGGRYIDKIFKPQALLTGGFALRIALSELIPQIFRFGSIDVAKSKIASSAAKLGYKLIPGEDEAILANATHALAEGTSLKDFIANNIPTEGSKIRRTVAKGLAKLADEKDLDIASQIAIATKGHMATGMTLTGHGSPYGDEQEFMRQLVDIAGQNNKKLLIKPTGKYSWYTPNNSSFPLHYTAQLHLGANTTSRRQIVADALAEMKSGKTADEAWQVAEHRDLARIKQVEYDPTSPTFTGNPLPKGQDQYAKERAVLASYTNEAPEAFAHRRVDIMRNLFQGFDGETNQELMGKIAKGETPSLDYVKNLDPKVTPSAVSGQEYEIAPPQNALAKITQLGFDKVLDPVINSLSRQPLFFNHVKNELSGMDWAVSKGHLGEDEALRIAMSRASVAMLPQIHNTMLRTQFSVYARNFMPFYFAQEQAMRRAGILITTHPYALHQYQLVQQGLNDPGFVQTDSLGQKHITLPGVGALGSSFLNAAAALGLPLVAGLPVTATGNLQSLRTVLPELNMPGVSPFISIAANTLESFDPTLARELKKVVGGAGSNRGLIDQLIPNAPMRNAFKALSPNEKESSFYNAIISSLAAAQFHGQFPAADASPVEMAAFYDRIKNNARSILWMKALVSTWSPLSPSISQEDPGMRDEFYNLMKQKSPVTGKNNTFPEALGIFLASHGNQAVSYTLGRSASVVPGAMMPYTTEAINWIEQNQPLLNSKNGVAAAFLIPQVSTLKGDAQAIHDELIKMHLRANKTPEDFMKSVYVAAGNNYVYTQKPIHDAAMKKLKDAGQSQAQERSNWSTFIQEYGKMNPLWEADYSSPVRTQNAVHAVQQLQNLFVSKNPPQGRQADLVSSLLRDWVTHAQAVQSYSNSNNSYATQTEKDNWQTYLDQMVESTPELNSVINSVFRRLS